ncbi:MAG: hypothetical protein NTY19_44895 [Planctomycetota bacterium]|nr:hypothetical protein [Planctomycetota bacterium]
MWRKWIWLAMSGVVFGSILGCGSGSNKVTGTAKIKGGGPLTSGRVMLYPDGSGKNATGGIGKEGTFTLGMVKVDDGALPGRYTVVITGAMEPETRTYEQATQGVGQAPKPLIHTKYTAATTSDLKIEVKPGANKFDFELDPYEGAK